MATIKRGLLGGFSGGIGSVQGLSWKGRAIMQGRVVVQNQTVTNRVLINRDKMGSLRVLLAMLRPFFFDLIVPVPTKLLPRWPLWIKMCIPYSNRTYDYYVSGKIFSKGVLHRAPELSISNAVRYPTFISFHVTNNDPTLGFDVRLEMIIWSRSLNKIVTDRFSAWGSLVFFVSSHLVPTDAGNDFVLMCFYRSLENPLLVSDSAMYRVPAVPV